MTLISDAEMAALRNIAESGMVTPVYIQTRTTDMTDENGWSETWVENPTPVSGWLYEFTPGGATISIIAGSMGLPEQVWLRLPVGTAVEAGDRARVGAQVFTVQHTNDASTYQPWLVCAVRIVI